MREMPAGRELDALIAERVMRVQVELNPDYAALARARITQDNPLLTDVA